MRIGRCNLLNWHERIILNDLKPLNRMYVSVRIGMHTHTRRVHVLQTGSRTSIRMCVRMLDKKTVWCAQSVPNSKQPYIHTSRLCVCFTVNKIALTHNDRMNIQTRRRRRQRRRLCNGIFRFFFKRNQNTHTQTPCKVDI